MVRRISFPHEHQKRATTLISVILLTFVTTISCRKQALDDEREVFGRDLIAACRAKDTSALLKLSWTWRDVREIRAVVERAVKASPQNPQDNNIFENESSGNSVISQKDFENELNAEIAIFLRSYEDLFDGIPVSLDSIDHSVLHDNPRLKEVSPRKAIIWVKKGVKYYGIKLEMVVTTRAGLRVADWVGRNVDPSQGALIKKRAILVRDTFEGCDYPGEIEYSYSYKR